MNGASAGGVGFPARLFLPSRSPGAMPKVVVQSVENGPNLVLIDGKASVAMCRCGHSEHKPLCDGTHRKVNYRAPAAQTTILE